MTIKKMFALVDLRITDIWNEAQTQISTKLEYPKFGFNEKTDTEYETTIQNFTGMGIADETGEEEPYNIDNVDVAGSVVLRPKKFTKSFSVSEETVRFSRWEKVSNATLAAMNSLNLRIDTNIAAILSKGFGTTFLAGPYGEPLFYATHALQNGATQSNYLGALPLTYDNLKTAAQMLDTQVDDKGIRLLNGHRKLLVVSQFAKHKAIELLKSIGNPDTANRVNNVWMTLEGEIELLVSNYIDEGGSAAKKYNWFLIDKERAGMMTTIRWAWKPRMNTDNVYNNGSKVYYASFMFKLGFSSHQFVVGSDAITI